MENFKYFCCKEIETNFKNDDFITKSDTICNDCKLFVSFYKLQYDVPYINEMKYKGFKYYPTFHSNVLIYEFNKIIAEIDQQSSYQEEINSFISFINNLIFL